MDIHYFASVKFNILQFPNIFLKGDTFQTFTGILKTLIAYLECYIWPFFVKHMFYDSSHFLHLC
jgi:hypothetical protein